MTDDDTTIPPYLCKPKDGTRERTVWMIHRIDARIAKLAELGLRSHPTMISYREELEEQLAAGGPYKLSVSSAFF